MHLTGRIGLETGLFTDAGPKPRNEDCLGVHLPPAELLATKGIVACIADGVSAASAGKEAAEAAVIGFITDYYQTPEAWEVKTAGQRVLTALNRWLFSQGQGSRAAEKGCVTTFTALVLKSQTGHVFHIGDSRLYRLRAGAIEQITRDHAAQVSADTSYLTHALGLTAAPGIDYLTFALEAGDRFLLTTDGIHGTLADAVIAGLSPPQSGPQACADALGAAAAASPDNRSCIVLDVLSLPDTDENDVFRQLSDLPVPPDLLPGQAIDGLEIEKILAASRTSQIYQVSDRDDAGRRLVLKTPSVSFEDDPAYLERFALEEWIGSRTDSPHLAKVIRRPRPRRFLYHVMEHVDGPTLGQWSREHQRPQIDAVIGLVAQIVEGVRALHRRDTLHQDLKPDNLLIGADGVLKIIDYGSCRVGGIAEIAAPFAREAALGTLDFSAPEYRLGIAPTTRADLFSVAAIAYHLLTGGNHPYGPAWEKARSPKEFAALVYRPAAAIHPMVPPWMDRVLRKALAIRPESRHEAMSEFIHDLRHPVAPHTQPPNLSFLERDPVRFWKILALIGFAGWLVTWMILRLPRG